MSSNPDPTLEERVRHFLINEVGIKENYPIVPGSKGFSASKFLDYLAPKLVSFYQKELVRDTARLRADLAGAIGHMEGCGHTYAYLIKNYPELHGKLTGEQP